MHVAVLTALLLTSQPPDSKQALKGLKNFVVLVNASTSFMPSSSAVQTYAESELRKAGISAIALEASQSHEAVALLVIEVVTLPYERDGIAFAALSLRLQVKGFATPVECGTPVLVTLWDKGNILIAVGLDPPAQYRFVRDALSPLLNDFMSAYRTENAKR